MSALDAFNARRAGGNGTAPAAVPAPLPPSGPAVSANDLRERRTRLAEELAELQWDLGGITYEMAIRDHFRLDVLVRKAGRLQQVDAELGEVERLVRLEDAGAGGYCPRCDALHSRGASFCWRCGVELMAGPAEAEQPTLVSAPPAETPTEVTEPRPGEGAADAPREDRPAG